MTSLGARKTTETRGTPTQLRLAPALSKRAKGPIIGGILLVIIAALLFGNASLRAGQRQAVIAVAKPVAAGHVLAAGDLKIVHVASDGGIAPMSSAQMTSVIGRPASVGLVPGTLLTASALGVSGGLGTNDAQVGLALKSGFFPPGLSAGATVRVVSTDAASNATLVERATVTSISSLQDSTTGTATMGLKVPASSANAVAGAAASDHVSLIEVAGQ